MTARTRLQTWRDRYNVKAVTAGAATAPLLILFGFNAVDELDRSVFALLAPEIRDAFGLDIQGVIAVSSIAAILALLLQVPVGYMADRRSRVLMATGGASVWAFFTLFTGLAPTVALLTLARASTAMGKAVNDPTHNSLLADYYPPESRIQVYGFHRAANSLGQITAFLVGGTVAFLLGWRAPFILFTIPTAVLVVLAFRYLREPVRGGQERRAAGAAQDAIDAEEAPAGFGEAWRQCSQVKTLRRIWMSLPLLAVSLGGIAILLSIYYEEEFGLNELERGFVLAIAEPVQVVGIIIGVPLAVRLSVKHGPGMVLKFLAVCGVGASVGLVLMAVAPNLAVGIAGHVIFTTVVGALVPGLYASLSLVIPPRARSMGFAIGSLFTVIGLPILFIIGGIADSIGIRGGIAVLVPIFLAGAFILASAGSFVAADIQKVRSSSLALAEARAARERGESKLIIVKGLDAGYDGVQVLFDVDFEIGEGEIVALLGTNGAGKSTLLRAISGLLPPTNGSILFDGAEIAGSLPHDIAARGIVQVPGGKGVFTSLTVEENLKIAGWLYARDPEYLAAATAQVLEFFPVLGDRLEQPAGNLSGGEQQMLTLSQAFIAKPKLLMIDELSLGLAPLIVEQLLKIVSAIRDRGTTIILVEQSVNVALTVAETAYFMEKGEIRFTGPTTELLRRPDILRSVFLEGAASKNGNGNGNGNGKSVNGTSAHAQVAKPKKRAVRAEAGEPVLLAADLTKSYGSMTAVDRVSLALRPNEILGIIGPNGAGKTTLFDLISGFVSRDSGALHFQGVDISDASPDTRARLGLGRSFQDARLFPALTVRETIALSLERHLDVRDPVAAALHLPAAIDSEAAASTRVEELIDLMGLDAFADKFVSELSTGSRRIVDLACIIAHEPSVILFDEPSSGIAQRETEALGPLLTRIRETTGASLLVIEHDMPLITSISDRLLALNLGAVLVEGLPDEVVRHPDVVSSYLGSTEAVIARSGVAPRAKRTRRSSVRTSK